MTWERLTEIVSYYNNNEPEKARDLITIDDLDEQAVSIIITAEELTPDNVNSNKKFFTSFYKKAMSLDVNNYSLSESIRLEFLNILL